MPSLNRLRRWLAGPGMVAAPNWLFLHQQAYWAVVQMVRFYYCATLYRITLMLYVLWLDWLAVQRIEPLWPVRWMVALPDLRFGVYVLGFGALAAGLLAVYQPQSRFYRGLVFLFLVQLAAFESSFGKVNHGLHAWLAISAIFIFLPHHNWERAQASLPARQRFLIIFWGAQALLLCFYTMSGLFKLVGIIEQLAQGQVSGLHPYALAYQTADRLLQNNTRSILGELVIQYPLLGWPLYLGAIYLESCAFWVAFRPVLHRLWAGGLILFHLGTWLTMHVYFPDNVLLLCLLLVNSPFIPTGRSGSTVLAYLPIFGSLFRRFQDFGRSIRKTNRN